MSWLAYITVWILGLAAAVLALVNEPAARVCLLAALFFTYGVILLIGIMFPGLGLFFISIKRGANYLGTVALTFDDGPHPTRTARLLDLLRDEKVPATFFVIGRAAEAFPDKVLRADAEGHLVGNHTYRHRAVGALFSDRGLRDELERASQVVAGLIRCTPRFVRLPFGLSRPGIARLLRRQELTSIGWDVQGLEWVYREPRIIAERIARLARNGSVIMLRESCYGTQALGDEAVLETARLTIALLRERGFNFVRLDQLLEQPGYCEK